MVQYVYILRSHFFPDAWVETVVVVVSLLLLLLLLCLGLTADDRSQSGGEL